METRNELEQLMSQELVLIDRPTRVDLERAAYRAVRRFMERHPDVSVRMIDLVLEDAVSAHSTVGR